MSDTITKTIKASIVKYINVDGEPKTVELDGIHDVVSARRAIKKMLGTNNFMVLPDIQNIANTYTCPLDLFMEFAKPASVFPPVVRVVRRDAYVTRVPVLYIVDGKPVQQIFEFEGKYTDTAIRTAIRRHLGTNNFMTNDAKETATSYAMRIGDFIELCDAIAADKLADFRAAHKPENSDAENTDTESAEA